MLKRVFAVEVLACMCGGSRRVLAVIKDERVTRGIPDHLGWPSQAPPLVRAAEEYAQPPAPEEIDQRWGTVDFAE